MSEKELEGKAAEEKAAEEEAKQAAEKLAAENQGEKTDEEIAEEARLEEEEQAEEDAKKVATEEHKEKSKLGRRMSAMEQQLTDFIESANQVLRPVKKDPVDGLDPDEAMTVGTYLKLQQQHVNEARLSEQEKARAALLYGRGYEKELHNIGDDIDEETHIQVMKLVTDTKDLTYSSRSSKDPAAAAQINYNKALRSLSGKPEKKFNLKGDKNLPNAGSPSKTKVKTEPEIKLSPEAREYARITGMSEKEVMELSK